jgi:hypothetical protein
MKIWAGDVVDDRIYNDEIAVMKVTLDCIPKTLSIGARLMPEQQWSGAHGKCISTASFDFDWVRIRIPMVIIGDKLRLKGAKMVAKLLLMRPTRRDRSMMD